MSIGKKTRKPVAAASAMPRTIDNAKSDVQLLSGLRRSAKSSQSDIAVKEVVLLLAVIRPYAGKAIALQLHTDLKRVHHCSSWLRQGSSTGRTPFTYTTPQ